MHLTDEQLNEYVDNETNERSQIEAHLATCADCAARLTALKTLFAELDALPAVALTRDFAARFTPTPSLPAKLPRWLTLTATLQAALAVIVLIFAAPFVSTILPSIELPSFADLLFQLQAQWLNLFDTMTNYQVPALPQLPLLEISNLMLSLTFAIASLLWLVGNGLLLRKQIK